MIEVAAVEKLFRERSLEELKSANLELERTLPARNNLVDFRRAFVMVVRNNYQIGNFGKVLALCKEFETRARFQFAHPTVQQYIRSYIADILDSGVFPKLLPEVYQPNSVETCIRAICSHLMGASSAPYVEKSIADSAEISDLSALLSVLSYYSVPYDASAVGSKAAALVIDKEHVSPALYGLVHFKQQWESLGDEARRYLFCAGIARSGTTALGLMLNGLQDVALFTELYSPYLGYSPRMFLPDVYKSEYFNSRPHYKLDSKTAEKLSRGATYVGDKRPLFLNSWELTKRSFPKERMKVVNIIREPAEVIQSYEKRAQASRELRDPWAPERTGVLAEIDLANQSKVLAGIADSEFAKDVLCVKYPAVLIEHSPFEELLDFLKIKPGIEERKWIGLEMSKNQEFLANADVRANSTAREFKFLTQGDQDWYRKALEKS